MYFLQALSWSQVLHVHSDFMWNLFWSMIQRMVLILAILNASGNLLLLAHQHLDTTYLGWCYLPQQYPRWTHTFSPPLAVKMQAWALPASHSHKGMTGTCKDGQNFV